MCLAIPARIVALSDDSTHATVEVDGVRKEISLALLDDVQRGDYVLVHVGFALNTLSAQEAQKTLELFAELAAAGENIP